MTFYLIRLRWRTDLIWFAQRSILTNGQKTRNCRTQKIDLRRSRELVVIFNLWHWVTLLFFRKSIFVVFLLAKPCHTHEISWGYLCKFKINTYYLKVLLVGVRIDPPISKCLTSSVVPGVPCYIKCWAQSAGTWSAMFWSAVTVSAGYKECCTSSAAPLVLCYPWNNL